MWLVATLVAVGAFILLAPSFINPPARPTASESPATLTPRPTLTPIASLTPLPLPPPAKQGTPLPLPGTAAGSKTFAFIADPTQSGYVVSNDAKPHWGDRNLHTGFFKDQTFHAFAYFDLSSIPPESKILYADLEFTGLSRDNLGPDGSWVLKALQPNVLSDWLDHSALDVSNSATQADFSPALSPADLDGGRINQFIIPPEQYSILDQAIGTTGKLALRMDGPTSGVNNLFTWDGGGLDLKNGAHPTLRIVIEPAQFVIVTNTPTAENVITAAAIAQTATNFAGHEGTPTPFPRTYATATPIIAVTALPTPENVETRVALAAYATAVAITTGTFTPTPPNWIVVTPKPTGLPTWTPSITPTPPAIPIGTAVLTLTPIATGTPQYSPDQLLQTPIPNSLAGIPIKGNILFQSDRFGQYGPQVMKPDGTWLGALTGLQVYNLAFTREPYSPDHSRRAIVEADPNGVLQIWVREESTGLKLPVTHTTKGINYDPAWSPNGSQIAYVSTETGKADIYVFDLESQTTRQITFTPDEFVFNQRPSWSPDSSKIVFKSNRDSGIFQIWVMNADGGGAHLLSPSQWNDIDPIWVK